MLKQKISRTKSEGSMPLSYGPVVVGHVVASDIRPASARWAALISGMPEHNTYGRSANEAVQRISAYGAVEQHVCKLRREAASDIMLAALKQTASDLQEILQAFPGQDVSNHPTLQRVRHAIQQAEDTAQS